MGTDPTDVVRTGMATSGFAVVQLMIHADDLHPGDIVDYGGHLHRVTRVDRGEGWSWPVACDESGWAMALGHDLIVLHCRAG